MTFGGSGRAADFVQRARLAGYGTSTVLCDCLQRTSVPLAKLLDRYDAKERIVRIEPAAGGRIHPVRQVHQMMACVRTSPTRAWPATVCRCHRH